MQEETCGDLNVCWGFEHILDFRPLCFMTRVAAVILHYLFQSCGGCKQFLKIRNRRATGAKHVRNDCMTWSAAHDTTTATPWGGLLNTGTNNHFGPSGELIWFWRTGRHSKVGHLVERLEVRQLSAAEIIHWLIIPETFTRVLIERHSFNE